jgi:hypothetical protein
MSLPAHRQKLHDTHANSPMLPLPDGHVVFDRSMYGSGAAAPITASRQTWQPISSIQACAVLPSGVHATATATPWGGWNIAFTTRDLPPLVFAIDTEEMLGLAVVFGDLASATGAAVLYGAMAAALSRGSAQAVPAPGKLYLKYATANTQPVPLVQRADPPMAPVMRTVRDSLRPPRPRAGTLAMYRQQQLDSLPIHIRRKMASRDAAKASPASEARVTRKVAPLQEPARVLVDVAPEGATLDTSPRPWRRSRSRRSADTAA